MEKLHHICGSNRNKPHYLQATNGNGCSCRVSFGGTNGGVPSVQEKPALFIGAKSIWKGPD